MKGIIAFDDLDAREGRRVIADETVTFAIDGHEVTLDLTAEHAGELREFLGRYIGTGGALTGKSSNGVAGVWTERRRYLKEFRKWADKNGCTYKTAGGNYVYDQEDIDRFDAWLAFSGAQGESTG